MLFTDFVSLHKPKLEKSITEYLDQKASTQEVENHLHAIESIKNSMHGGKMLRGMLVILGAQLYGSPIDKQIYYTGAAVELLQAALLIHDDIMDNDYKRRHKDAIFYHYLKIGKEKKVMNPLLFGQSMGLCIGDVCFSFAFELISKHVHDPACVKEIIINFSKELQYVHLAQMTDVMHSMTDYEPPVHEIMDKYIYKTARYTFTLPLLVGSLFYPNSDNRLIKQFGEDVGILFQLKDDELGIFGSEDEIGKKTGSDIRENKKTLLRYYLLNRASAEDTQILMQTFGKPDISGHDIDFVRRSIKKYKIQAIIEKECAPRKKRISSTLEEMNQKGLDTQLLQEVVEYTIHRTK